MCVLQSGFAEPPTSISSRWSSETYLFFGFLRHELLQLSIVPGDIFDKLFDDDLDPLLVLFYGADLIMKLVLLILQFLSKDITPEKLDNAKILI